MIVNEQTLDILIPIPGEPPERVTKEEEFEELFDMFLGRQKDLFI